MFLDMSLWFLGAAVALFAAGMLASGQRLRTVAKPLAAALAVMLLLTAIFDNLMIYAGLFDYGSGTLSGVRIGLAPIEDFFYAACAVFLIPGLWWLLGGREANPPKRAADGKPSRKAGA